MPEWTIWAIGIWFFFNVMGGGGSCSRRFRDRRLYRVRNRAALEDPRHPFDWWEGESYSTDAVVRATAAKPEQVETPEERIRRRFVEGWIDLVRGRAVGAVPAQAVASTPTGLAVPNNAKRRDGG